MTGGWLVDRQQLHVEEKRRVRWDAGDCLVAVRKARWNRESSLGLDPHAKDTNIPAFDNLASADLEVEWLALFVRCRRVLESNTSKMKMPD